MRDTRRVKRAVVVSCVYPPEPVVSAQTSAQVAEKLRFQGHDVTVLTGFPNRPAGRLYPGVTRRFAKHESTESGVRLVRCFAALSPESSLFSRLLENLSFGLSSGWQLLTMRKPDVIYANSWPIIATGILFLIAKLRRIPLVISVQDVYPEALLSQNRLAEGGLPARLMNWIDGVIARGSAHVIVISERFVEIYRRSRRVPPTRLSLIPNWVDESQLDAGLPGEPYRAAREIKDGEFLVVYAGNVGAAAGVETAIESMRFLADAPDVRLLVAGSGSRLDSCRGMAEAFPGKVLFHSPWHVADHPEVLRAANLLLLPTQGSQSLASVPSKLLSYMLAGRPVLATALAGSDLAELVVRADCGWVIAPDRPDLLAAKIREIMNLDADELRGKGENGRGYVVRHLTTRACLPKVTEILDKLAGDRVV